MEEGFFRRSNSSRGVADVQYISTNFNDVTRYNSRSGVNSTVSQVTSSRERVTALGEVETNFILILAEQYDAAYAGVTERLCGKLYYKKLHNKFL